MISYGADGANTITEAKLPANLEAELGVLGSCLLSRTAIDDCLNLIGPGDFFRDSHAELFRAIMALHEQGGPADFVTLGEYLERQGRFQAVGGNATLQAIHDAVPHAANAEYYARIVREKSITRRVLEAAQDIAREALANQLTAAELLAAAESRIFAIGESEATGDTLEPDDLATLAAALLERRDQGEVEGVSTGFSEIDWLTDGLRPEQLVILAARPSQGKTALALNIASHLACDLAASVLFVSLEMSRQELADRLVSSLTLIDATRIKRGNLSDRNRQDYLAALATIAKGRLRINDTPARNLSQIAANARRVKSRDGLALLVIDYLGLIDGQRARGENRQEEVARISRRLKALARELKVPVLCLHQLNRQSELREDRKPRLADLRESGQIEADADVVMLLHRPEFYDPNDQPGIAELIVAKNRNGATGMIRLVFVKSCTRFDSLDRTADPRATF